LGDAEFLLIFNHDAPLPAQKDLDHVQREIENNLRPARLFCAIELSAGHPSYLRNLRPHIYAYELRNCGRIVWGSPRVLSLIPDFIPSEIPWEDGWRLLGNRMIEHLAVAGASIEPGQPLGPEVLYSTVKLSLDMATSFLLFCGLYAPTYQKRSERLGLLANAPSSDVASPFPLRDFAELVEWATRCKLSPDSTLAANSDADCKANRHAWITAVTFAASLWQWELARLSGLEANGNWRALMKSWMRKQTFYDRARGWASLLRRPVWKGSVSSWPRWGRLAFQASPRYWIYSAAAEVFFALPAIAESNTEEKLQSTLDKGKIRRSLPVCQSTGRIDPPDWRHLASDIFWNYREFLKETRS
jgi:hypothetical protein